MEFEKDSQKSWNVVSSLINNNQVLKKKDDKNQLRRIPSLYFQNPARGD